jgi:uncharacterized protein
MRGVQVLIGSLWLSLASAASAQTGWRAVAVPYYTPPAFVQGLHEGWTAPRAREFARAAAELSRAMEELCGTSTSTSTRTGTGNNIGNGNVESSGGGGTDKSSSATGRGAVVVGAEAARSAWRQTLLAWSRVASVAVGPLIERRSARRIDMHPLRPALMAAAIDGAPASAEAMERIGSPAKGFAALEALLWPTPAAAGTPACAYAVQVAADIEREAVALASAFDAAARAAPDDDASVAAMSEAVNQWLAGVDALRLQGFERPRLEGRSRGASGPLLPRAASGASADERGARWQALAALALFEGAEAPAPGAGLVPLEAYLRGKGLNPLADRLANSVRQAGHAVDAARGDAPARLQAAARALARLKALAEAEVAPALDIRLGFSDADGD